MTVGERRLAERPEPGRGFERLTGQWDGVPGWAVLRERWREFGKTEPAFAVLAALLSEVEGEPDRAVTELRVVPGPDARWNEGRLLAILGREAEAVRVLTALVTDPACEPRRAAEAALALTELECLKGDFAAALARSYAAWAARSEEDFRLRLVERHLSLLVEAGQGVETVFVNQIVEQSVDPARSGEERAAALRLMAVLAEWMPSDSRLAKARAELSAGVILPVRALDRETIPPRPMELSPGWDFTPEEALKRVSAGEKTTLRSLEKAAGLLRKNRAWPEHLQEIPVLRKWFEADPEAAMKALFPSTGASGALPPLFRNLVSEFKPGSARRLALELTDRAWAGKFGGVGNRNGSVPENGRENQGSGRKDPEAVRALEHVILAARPFEDPDGIPSTSASLLENTGTPDFRKVARFPSPVIWWNFTGAPFAEYYAMKCRVDPFISTGWLADAQTDPGDPVTDWEEWRPIFPRLESDGVAAWAWRELTWAGMATPERAASLAGRIPDEASRVTFACMTRQKGLIASWLRDRELAKRLPSRLLGACCSVLLSYRSDGPDASVADLTAAVENCRNEVAHRLGFDPMDFRRSGLMSRGDPARPEWLEQWRKRPVIRPLLMVGWGYDGDQEWQEARKLWGRNGEPHPLTGLRVCPSVDNLRCLGWQLVLPEETFHFFENRAYELAWRLMGNDGSPSRGQREAVWQLDEGQRLEMESFTTAHPLKRWIRRWWELAPAGDRARDAGRRVGTREEPGKILEENLRTLAGEEKASLPWHLIAAALEKNSVKKELFLELLKKRSPAVADLPVARPKPAAGNDGDRLGECGDPVENLLEVVRRLLADPARRAPLEISGAISVRVELADRRPNDHLGAVLAGMSYKAPDVKRAVEALLDFRDPLAARLAVTLAEKSREGSGEEILKRALTLFPDDPDLLLADAAGPGQQPRDPAARREAFVRGLAQMKSLISISPPYPGALSELWCGRQLSWDGNPGSAREVSPEEVAAIVAFVRRTGARQLPAGWDEALQHFFRVPGGATRLLDAPATLRVMLRCLPANLSSQDPAAVWQALSSRLASDGQENLRREAAEILLTGVDGGGGGGDSGPVTEPGAPLTATEAGRDKFAVSWRLWEHFGENLRGQPDPVLKGLLNAASGTEPQEVFLTRLKTLAAQNPANGPAALTALVAIGASERVRPEDMSLLDSLPQETRLRVMACVSRSVREDALPEHLSLLHEAWEWECRTALEKDPVRLDRALTALAQLEKAGAGEVLGRQIPRLLKALQNLPLPLSGPEPSTTDMLVKAFRLILGKGAESDRAACRSFLEFRLKSGDGTFGSFKILAALIRLFPEDDEVPAPLAAKVDAALKAMREKAPSDSTATEARRQLAGAVALRPRWQPAVREMVAANPDGWRFLTEVFLSLDGGPAVPDPALVFEATGPGKGTLRWRFRGLMTPPQQGEGGDPGGRYLDARALARTLEGKFDAVVTAEDPMGLTRSVVARLSALPASGSVLLAAGLPPVGKLQMILSQSGPLPAITGTPPALAYDTWPLVCSGDAWGGPPASAGKSRVADPPGWRLLCQPVEMGQAKAWHVRNAGNSENAGDDGIAAGNSPDEAAADLRGGYLVFLDESGQVCSACDLASHGNGGANAGFVDFPGTVVVRGSLKPWIEPAASGDAARPSDGKKIPATATPSPAFAVSGGPKLLALAVRSAPLSGTSSSSSSVSSLAPSRPLVVREWPLPEMKRLLRKDRTSAGSATDGPEGGRLEITRMLRASAPEAWPEVVISTARPLRAAWVTGGRLHLVTLEPAEPGTAVEAPRILTLPEGFERGASAVMWRGASTISVLAKAAPIRKTAQKAAAAATAPAAASGAGRPLPEWETRLANVDVSAAEPAISSLHVLKGDVRLLPESEIRPGEPAVLAVQVNREPLLAGVILPDARFLPWPDGETAGTAAQSADGTGDRQQPKPAPGAQAGNPAGAETAHAPKVEWSTPVGPQRLVFGLRSWTATSKDIMALDWTDGTLRLVRDPGKWESTRPQPKEQGTGIHDPLLPGQRLEHGEITRRFGPLPLQFTVLISVSGNQYLALERTEEGFALALCRDTIPPP